MQQANQYHDKNDLPLLSSTCSIKRTKEEQREQITQYFTESFQDDDDDEEKL